MRPSMAILIAVLICRPALAWAETGLVAHWTFDEGQGREVRDASGRGHHGSIRGGAKWTPGRRGSALEFNGVDSLVEIANPQGLNLAGDMTFTAWVQTTSDDGRDRLLFGDTAGLAVNRNLSIELDRGALHVGHGNDVQYESFGPNLKFDGDWKHLAVLFEEPRYYLYVNGVLYETGVLAMPVSRTHGAGRAIGGWFAGYFKGVLDEVQLYDRALSEREIVALAAASAPPADQTARISLAPRFKAGVLQFNALFTRLAAAGARVNCTLTRKGEISPCLAVDAPMRATRPDSERAFAEAVIPMKDLARGTYLLAATAQDGTGKPVGTVQKEVAIPDPPAWLGSKAGISDVVLPPYTPIEVKKDANAVRLNVWGREYRLGNLALPEQIVSRDASLLSGPARLQAVVNGKQVSWSTVAPSIHQQTAALVALDQTAPGGPVTVQSRARLEYDGLLRTELTLSAATTTLIQSLVLEIPIQKEHAKYLYTWPTSFGRSGHSGQLVRPMELGFFPIVWIGDELRGLSWMCESEDQWSPDDTTKAIRVVPGDGQVVLRIGIIGKPIALHPARPLKYVFAFQATPLKPIEKDGWALRFGSCPWYGDDYDLLKNRTFRGKPALAGMKELGVRTLMVWNWTSALAYPWPLERAADFKALVQACHAQGIRVIPYLGYQISEKAPEFPCVRDEVLTFPPSTNADKYPGKPTQMVSTVCLRSVWQDALADYVARMMEEFDIDGVYVDSTDMPFPCKNALHGCDARRADGTTVPVYPIFATRDTFRRLYTVVKSKKPDGIVDSHVYDCMNSAALAFATSYWTGEQLSAADIPTDSLPLDRFRTEFMGVNWGVPGDMLSYKLGSFRKSLAVSLPHDVLVRYRQDEVPVDSGENEDLLARSIWKLADDFGRSSSRFTPYYSPERPVPNLPSDWIASTYRHPTNGVLVIVSNLGRKEQRARLTPDWKALGIATPGPVLDGLTRQSIPLNDGSLDISLPPSGWKYVWIQRAK